MIPAAQITQWRQFAPWPDDMQVEQDLILSRIIVEIFSDPLLSKQLAFRGGTALHKLFFNPPARYSEDIDLVRTNNGAIKPIIDALHNRLNPLLGEPKTERNAMSFKLRYYFNPENSPSIKLRIKIEINVRESFTVFDYFMKPFSVLSDWFTGETHVRTYQFEELLATKLRALYQRKKGRDLFDLWLALQQKDLDIPKVIHAFNHYLSQENNKITRNLFEKNLAKKLQEPSFIDDIEQLLAPIYMKDLSMPLKTLNNEHFKLMNGESFLLMGKWSIYDAAEDFKNKILSYLPE